jgi:cytochrome P450
MLLMHEKTETIARKSLFELLTDPADDRDAFYNAMPDTHDAYRDASGTWMVGRYRLASAVLNHPDLTTRSPLFEHGLLTDDAGLLDMMLFENDATHDRLRKAFAPLFAKARLAALRAHVEADVDRLIAQIPDPRRFDLVERIAQRLPALTTCRLLGIDVEHAPRLIAQSMAAVRLISAAPLTPSERRQVVAQTIDFLHELEPHVSGVRALLEEHLSGEQAALPQGVLTQRQLLANILLMFIAGYGTTMLSIGNTVAQALARPGLWDTLVREPRLAPQTIRELMRIDPAVHVMIRFARADIELDGLRAAKGDVVAVVAAAANRDPAEFEAPTDVRLERAHAGLVFGAGSHGCIGVALARMQLGVVFETLLARMPDLALAAGPHPRLQEGAFRGYRSLHVRNGQARRHARMNGMTVRAQRTV